MDMMMLSVWGSVIFGALTVILVGAWVITGRKNQKLQLIGGITTILAVASASYMTYAT